MVCADAACGSAASAVQDHPLAQNVQDHAASGGGARHQLLHFPALHVFGVSLLPGALSRMRLVSRDQSNPLRMGKWLHCAVQRSTSIFQWMHNKCMSNAERKSVLSGACCGCRFNVSLCCVVPDYWTFLDVAAGRLQCIDKFDSQDIHNGILCEGG